MIQRLLLAVPIVVVLAGPGTGDVWAQPEAPVRFEQITTEDGLSQSTVFAAVQDRQGFLWFGTEDGLNRYDGRSFRVYRHHPDDATSLSNNWVWTLFVDRGGTLWVGTLGGGLNRDDGDRVIRPKITPRGYPCDAPARSLVPDPRA